MRELVKSFLDWYLAALDAGGYPLIAFLMALESSIVPLPSDMGQVLQPYPLWLRARPTSSVIGEGVGEVFLPWTSSIDTTGAKGSVAPLLVSSNAAGIAEQEVDISPTREFPPVDLKTRILAATSSPSAKDSTAPKGRVAVVGSSDFVSDRYASRATANVVFTLNAIDWLAQDPVTRVLASDGGARSAVWMQIVADVIQMPVNLLAGHPGSCLGAAFVAGMGIGAFGDWGEIARFVAPAGKVEPRAANAGRYDDLYRLYRVTYERLRPGFAEAHRLMNVANLQRRIE